MGLGGKGGALAGSSFGAGGFGKRVHFRVFEDADPHLSLLGHVGDACGDLRPGGCGPQGEKGADKTVRRDKAVACVFPSARRVSDDGLCDAGGGDLGGEPCAKKQDGG